MFNDGCKISAILTRLAKSCERGLFDSSVLEEFKMDLNPET